MAISHIIKNNCDTCGKWAVEVSRFTFGKSTMIKLQCGHMATFQSEVLTDNEYADIVFSDGAKPRPYQVEAMQFAARNNFNVIIADEQGLGKTIELLGLLRMHYEKLLPAILVVPSTVQLQWMREIIRICVANREEHKRTFLTQVISSSKEKALPGFGIYIITYDKLKKNGEEIFEWVPEIKTLVMDECQRIKNHLSERAKACQKFADRTQFHIPMSGTPIKNHAGEYFTALNIVAPRLFPQYQRFIDEHCDSYETGWQQKIGGLKNAQEFHALTKDIIIRRKKDEVLRDLPAKERKFYHVELDPRLNKAYAAGLKELEDLLYSEEDAFTVMTNKIAIMSKLRHITGQSKVDSCVDFVTEFLESTDRMLTIFRHHDDVGEILKMKLDEYLAENGYGKCLTITSQQDMFTRARMAENFEKDSKSRVMIASTLAAGEGLNLQFCSDAIMLERQWNPANEVQAEDRFHRFGQKNNVGITYMLASGTIDEYFTELVEQKRSIVASTLDNEEIEWQESSLMKELAEILVTRGRDKWRL